MSRQKICICLLVYLFTNPVYSNVVREKFIHNGHYLIVEVLRDDLIHFEVSAVGEAPNLSRALYTTPMVAKNNYPGPSVFQAENNTFKTSELIIEIGPINLCVSVFQISNHSQLMKVCPFNLENHWKGLTITKEQTQNIYGLGEQFTHVGDANGDWMGRVRSPGNGLGNAMVDFNGGGVGNAMFPIFYALGENNFNYAFFLDQAYKQEWDFRSDPFKVEMWGDQIRWYVMSGDSLITLRKSYMELVGKPEIPPKKMFGLWVSEYGFDNWEEMENKLASLRANKFPVDGFVLDLQWFGGVKPNSDASPMGKLSWDLEKFPNPKEKIHYLRDNEGIGIMTIEESYVSKGLSEHKTLEERGFLAKDCIGCGASYLTGNPWWGKGGILDWTNPVGADFWHDWKRQALINDGVMAHWLDLGEPEMFNPTSWYYGFPELGKDRHPDVHNIFNLKWAESIYRGYDRHKYFKRPFMMARSGTSGIQRYGVAMWSGDIGSNLTSLASHHNAQMHMSFSGMDYFGSDVGGFHRAALQGDQNEMYTQWFANSAMFDIPLRPHTENLCNCKETSPDRIGDKQSNLENLRLRYALSPYFYSLAYKAHLDGEPIYAPLVFYYQNDKNIRSMGHEKLIGRDLLAAIVARHGETKRDVYLPKGVWFDFYSHEKFFSGGDWVKGISEYPNGRFRLPLFAKAGSIIPKMYVDDQTLNVLGKRLDGVSRKELLIQVFEGDIGSSFTLYEDDGETIAYKNGDFRTTLLSYGHENGEIVINVDKAQGSYINAPDIRQNVIEYVTTSDIKNVFLNNNLLTKIKSSQEFDAGEKGWFQDHRNLILIKTGHLNVSSEKNIRLSRN